MNKSILFLIVVLLVAPASLRSWTIEEGFEGGAIPAGWTVIDARETGMHGPPTTFQVRLIPVTGLPE